MPLERASAFPAGRPALDENAGDRSRDLAYRLLLLLVFCTALAARWLPGPRTIDDAWITFRYTQNILAGNGFVYNPGEQVLGTTTPLFTILLTLLGLAGGGAEAPFPVLALGASALADGLTCLLLAWLGRRLGFPRAGLAAALAWAVAPFSVTFASGGLETSLFVFLLVALAWAHLSGRRLLAALAAALALLTRPDALILLGPYALDRAWLFLRDYRTGRQAGRQARLALNGLLQEAGVFLLCALPWFLFAFLYFGSPIPHSITAKTLAYRLSGEEALVRLIQHYATPFLEHLSFGNLWVGVGLLLHPFLFLAGGLQGLRRSPRLWPFLAYPWLYFAAFAAANPLIFRWYLTPPLPFYFLAILIGIERLASALLRLRPAAGAASPAADWRAALAGLALCLPALLSLRGWTLRPDHGLSRPAPEMAYYQLELLYQEAAAWVNQDLERGGGPEQPALAAGDVGVLGFFTGLPILDTVGLNSPQTAGYYPLDPALYSINYAIPPDLILDQQPDYLVTLEVYGRLGLLKDPRFQAAYELAHQIPTGIYGSEGMLIFKKRY